MSDRQSSRQSRAKQIEETEKSSTNQNQIVRMPYIGKYQPINDQQSSGTSIKINKLYESSESENDLSVSKESDTEVIMLEPTNQQQTGSGDFQNSQTYNELCLVEENKATDTYNLLCKNDFGQQNESYDEEYEPLTMADIKFSSCPNLTAALACCQLDYEEGEHYG